ncbi:lipoyl(octanoyl) transferase LipB [Schaalia suimastitidis]|uniref:lipoyl(octanoyl) transferase LipB n=1 Tax=Schaalia suimastitidis TaxID=121163 RepID=UPI0004295F7B|nr:lipoyl(octanoyl) transferase LipB [Schaalia suimastitidis]
MRIVDLLPRGLTDYLEVDRLQRALHSEVVAGGEDALIVAEFTPTWTAGRHTKPQDIPDTTLEVIPVDRAGSATWHGPGQLVVYPVVKLKEPVDTLAWIRSVEAGVLSALRDVWGLDVERIDGRAGVWIREAGLPDRKICAIGLKVARGATLHGIALNVSIDMGRAFSGIIPCGLVDADVASLHCEGVTTTVVGAANHVVTHLVASISGQLARPATTVTRITDMALPPIQGEPV